MNWKQLFSMKRLLKKTHWHRSLEKSKCNDTFYGKMEMKMEIEMEMGFSFNGQVFPNSFEL